MTVYSGGLGIAYYYDNGYVPVPGKDYDNSSLHVPFSNDIDYSNATRMSFCDHSATCTVANISQSPHTALVWVKFILDESEGFTDIGIERINDSKRTYILRVQTREENFYSKISRFFTIRSFSVKLCSGRRLIFITF